MVSKNNEEKHISMWLLCKQIARFLIYFSRHFPNIYNALRQTMARDMQSEKKEKETLNALFTDHCISYRKKGELNCLFFLSTDFLLSHVLSFCKNCLFASTMHNCILMDWRYNKNHCRFTSFESSAIFVPIFFCLCWAIFIIRMSKGDKLKIEVNRCVSNTMITFSHWWKLAKKKLSVEKNKYSEIQTTAKDKKIYICLFCWAMHFNFSRWSAAWSMIVTKINEWIHFIHLLLTTFCIALLLLPQRNWMNVLMPSLLFNVEWFSFWLQRRKKGKQPTQVLCYFLCISLQIVDVEYACCMHYYY